MPADDASTKGSRLEPPESGPGAVTTLTKSARARLRLARKLENIAVLELEHTSDVSSMVDIGTTLTIKESGEPSVITDPGSTVSVVGEAAENVGDIPTAVS